MKTEKGRGTMCLYARSSRPTSSMSLLTRQFTPTQHARPHGRVAAITAYSAGGADDEMHFGLSARLFLALQPVFVLKIDVEAYEPTVFEGAQRLMDRNPVRASPRRANAVVSSRP